MLMVISYDIQSDKLRNKVSKILEDFGTRVQYSVFECDLTDDQLDELKKRLSKKYGEKDSVRFYYLCMSCINKVEIIGNKELNLDKKFYIV